MVSLIICQCRIFNPAINRGLKWFNALDDESNESTLLTNNITQKAQYTSVSLYSYFTKNFIISKAKIPLNYSLTFNGQYSKDELYGSEQLFVGGFYTVRGFRNTSIGGDKGYNVRNEIKYDFRNLFTSNNAVKYIPTFITNTLSKTSITPFFDYGYVKSNAINQVGNEITGTGVKLDFNGKNIASSLVWAKSLSVPLSLIEEHKTKDGNDVIYFSLKWEM